VFKHFESDMALRIGTLGDPTPETAESNDIVQQIVAS